MHVTPHDAACEQTLVLSIGETVNTKTREIWLPPESPERIAVQSPRSLSAMFRISEAFSESHDPAIMELPSHLTVPRDLNIHRTMVEQSVFEPRRHMQ